MTSPRWRLRPLKDTVWLLVALVTVTMVISLHLGNSLLWFRWRPKLKLSQAVATVPTLQRLSSPQQHTRDGLSTTDQTGHKSGNHNDNFGAGALIGKFSTDTFDFQPPVTMENSKQHKNKASEFLIENFVSNNRPDLSHPDGLHAGNTFLPSQAPLDSVSPSQENDLKISPFKPEALVSVTTSWEGHRQATRQSWGSSQHALLDRLSQIEESLMPSPPNSTIVMVLGPLSSIQHHLPLLESAFSKTNVRVVFQADEVNLAGSSWQRGAMSDNWSILMCLNNTVREDNCVVTTRQAYQKVNVIPQLTEVLMAPQLLCVKTKSEQEAAAQETEFLFESQLRCDSSIKYQHEFLKNKLTSCNSTYGWWVNNAGSTTLNSFYFPCKEHNLPEFLLNHLTAKSVIINLPKNLMTVDGSSPFVWQIEMLVTSLSPIRFYIHPNGLTWDGLQGYSSKKQQKNVSVTDLRQLITDLASEEVAISALNQLNKAVFRFMKLFEQFGSTAANQRLCERCFQILEALVIFNSTFHPFILQITPFKFPAQLISVSNYLLEQSLFEDLAVMLASRESVALDIVSGLGAYGITQVKSNLICSEDNKICLNNKQVLYLLDTRREQKALKNWIRIFPTNENLNNSHNLKSSKDPSNHFENLIKSVEQYFLGSEEKQDKMRLPDGNINSDILDDPKASVLHERYCDNDTISLPHLSAIKTVPLLRLYPLFSPFTTEYHAYVDYSITMVQILGVPKHCMALVRIEDIEENNRLSNISIGIGKNTVLLQVNDLVTMEPLSTYKIFIHRRSTHQSLRKFYSNLSKHQVCFTKQDCSLLITPSETCGLHQTQFDKWDNFLAYHMPLPQCEDDSLTGQWLVPCTNCSEISSCYWNNAIWYQEGCREKQLSKQEIQNCFHGKKVLFIGDSTNRGILHYISERLNDSLMEWDKTHTIRVYDNLNEGHTVFGFAYYPQFWLSANKRPQLDKALTQLIKRTSSMLKLIIVLGGVQWLSKRHIDMIVSYLESEGLKDYKVIIKGLGAGFHQPVTGVHHLSEEDHQKLYLHNEAVLSYARSKGFTTVDTYRMTMARFKDFMPGKCSCHFHKVVPLGENILNKLSHKGLLLSDYNTKYHVEGEINAVYSEMVINRICSKGQR